MTDSGAIFMDDFIYFVVSFGTSMLLVPRETSPTSEKRLGNSKFYAASEHANVSSLFSVKGTLAADSFGEIQSFEHATV